ncbi:hypothetical protein DMC16_04865 [Lacticaseibacillus paracasei]|uniref:VaFE repeat-containing surface-anchored protein n=1 Tax=Lacticaseibacillus paracasei TaxID=1597 RepID=UPI000D75DB53|nr:VaFE repeat-containing surface-anchored protein [Lacticaseibacillus paracasei]AWR90513.1 hypothetical protein DMC16_04865 [Lacticaseibacillus paracasei]
MQHKWLKATLFIGAVALGLVGGQLHQVSATADTDVPESMAFSRGAFAANTDGAGYMMVRHADGSLNYMISDSFKDSLGNYAYCLDSERPTPVGQTESKGSIGSDAQYRLFKYGFNNHSATDQEYWDIEGLTDQEAWYATQTVSWILAGNFNWNQIVWQASQPGDFADGIYAPYGEAAVKRVRAAATKVYNNVMNNHDTANTTMTLADQGETEVQGYHKFTYTVQSNQTGTATLNFKNIVDGMKVVDAKGNAIANNTVTIGQAFSLLIPNSTPTGDLTFDINGNIKAIVPVVYKDAAQKYQDSISLVTGVVKPLLAGNKAKWTRATGLIKVHKVDQNGQALTGIEFTLEDNLGNKQTALTDKDGDAQFTIVVDRTYSLKETKTLTGYTGSFQKDGITLANDGQVFSYTVVNAEDVAVHTTATSDGKKSVDANKQMIIDDVVHATGLIVGKTYTVKGQLYDKATGKALIVNGKPVTAETTFVAKASVQDVTVHFAFDGSDLGGHDVVVFEDLYLGDKKVASHADLNDKEQTVHVTTPTTPETPTTPVTPVTPSTPSTPAPKPTVYQAKMPQTGDAHDNVLAVLGVALVALVSGFSGFKIYKKRQA